jgi:hypothetical protein
MHIEEEIVVVESVGGVDGPLVCEDVATNNSNIESVQLILGNSLENEVLQLVQVQVALWKPHHQSSICWGFFIVNCLWILKICKCYDV